MRDWLLDHVGWVISGALVGVLILFVFLLLQDRARKEVLWAECLSDGRKAYECEAMLSRDSSTMIAPVYIHGGK